MDEDEYCFRGYTDWPDYRPPNHPKSLAAYDHGWKNRKADHENALRFRNVASARAAWSAIKAMPEE